jgi:carboxyl-terminal processing protease
MRTLATLAFLAVLLSVGGCSRAEPNYFDGDEVASVFRFMDDRYLFASSMPAADLSGLATAEQALAALRVDPPDRFSYVADRVAFQAFYDNGRALGLGIGLLLDDSRLRLRFVHPDSPAAAAGLQRGDEIVAIDGADVAGLLAAGRLAAAIGPNEVGYTLRLDMRRNALMFAVSVAKDWHEVEPVMDARVIDTDHGPVGYVALYTFSDPASEAWRRALASIVDAGARALIVDLRDNGGGRVAVAADIAASLAPPTAEGAVFARLRHNERNGRRNRDVVLPQSDLAGRIERIVWITSRRSCSAAELLIAGLAPYVDASGVGLPSCGKPIGASPVDLGNKVLNAVTFSTENAVGLGGWFGGLPPACAVPGETLQAWGDPSDPWLASALGVLAGGACPTAPGQVSPLSRPGELTADPTTDGFAAETGFR